ncbi:MAG: HPr family phosphocarrier protein [Mycoplasmataceae bacterium]|nr:HPr family phosphocarrier protein [Mycoplasmataceae bacterium]
MPELKVTIKDPIGLHARPASITVSAASKFESDITITSDGKTGNLKSIMNVMALGVKQNAVVVIEATGADAEDALKAIEKAMKENNLI